MGIKIFTKSGKSGKNDKYIQKSYNARMKHFLSHFHSLQNAFTNDIFDKYENSSRAEDVAAKAMSESQFITINYLFEFSHVSTVSASFKLLQATWTSLIQLTALIHPLSPQFRMIL